MYTKRDIFTFPHAYSPQLNWASCATAIIQRFGGPEAKELFANFQDLQDPINTMTLAFDPHFLFDRLDIWLMTAGVRLLLLLQ